MSFIKKYRILSIILIISSLLPTLTQGNNTPQPMLEIETFISKQSKPVTAYDIEAYFISSKEQVQAPEAIQATTFGTEAKFSTSGSSGDGDMAVAALDATHFVVASKIGTSASARVGEVSGTTITYGTANTFNTNSVNSLSIGILDATHFVIAYQDDPFSLSKGNGTAIVGEVSGTTITFGSKNIFNSTTSTNYPSNFLTVLDATHFAIAYTNGTTGVAIVGEVSGTTITSYGSANVFHTGSLYAITITTLDATHFVIAYGDDSNSYHGTAIIGEVSGTTITSYGSKYVFNSASTSTISVATLDATNFIVAYRDVGNSNHGTVIIGQVSGTTISYGNEVVFNAGGTYLTRRNIAVLSSTKVVIIYSDEGDSYKGHAIAGVINGTSIGFSSSGEEEFVGQTSYPNAVALSSTHYVAIYDNRSIDFHSYARIGDATNAPLPVELTYFKGKNTSEGNLLTWQTASEQNNEGFEIERSSDGKTWKMIDFVQGRGTTQELLDYTYTDLTPMAGINYYRLKQVDFDGQFEYSDMVTIEAELLNKEVQIFPNPLTNQVNIQGLTGAMTIYNSLGQVVKQVMSNESSTTILMNNLPSGQYTLEIVSDDGRKVVQQLVKQE